MVLSKTKTRNVSAPVSETVSTDAPPPCAAEPNAPAAAGLDGRNGARGTIGSGRELVVAGCAACAGCDRARLDWATTTRVKASDSSRTSVRLRTTLCLRTNDGCLRTNDGCLAGGPVCGVPTACEELSSTWLGAGNVVGTTPVRGTTPASIRCTSTVGGGGIDGIVKTGNGGKTAGTEGGTGGGGRAGCATGCDVAAILEAEALEAALVAARFDWDTSPSFPGLAIRIETATLHWTQTDGTAAAGAGAPAGQSHCQFQIQIVAPAGGAGTPGVELGSQFQLQFQIQTSGGVGESGSRCVWCNTRRIITGSITAGISSHGPRWGRVGQDGRAGHRCRTRGSGLWDGAPGRCGCRLRGSGGRRRRRLGGRRCCRYYRWYRR